MANHHLQPQTRSAGYRATFTPHSARRTATTLALEAGATLTQVQDLLGHADPRTTRRYDDARHTPHTSPAFALARLSTPHADPTDQATP